MTQPLCELCGEPMPAGEEMFKFHGFSGSCPKPPLPKATDDSAEPVTVDWLVGNGWDRGIHWPNRVTASKQIIEWRGAGLWIENTPIALAATKGKLRQVMEALL